jgi:modification methylase
MACHKGAMAQKTITRHQFFLEDARTMSAVEDRSVHLVVTSPPYPMIGMWDDHFSAFNVAIGDALSRSDAELAFDLMHRELDGVWRELYRVLAPGGILCINIGDATRTIQGHFRLYPNHARVIQTCQSIGFSQMPTILWRKTTNAPNKFMGSGMFPPGAYVTLEHEYILIFRKGAKREFLTDEQKSIRRESAYFWEERNHWFSDVWTGLPGSMQNLNHSDVRKRSAAFPLTLAYRLINMFSVKGDTVLDPFLGSGTTMLAAMCTGRNAVGYEIDQELKSVLLEKIASVPDTAQELIDDRLTAHHLFIKERTASKGDLKYINRHYGFPVMTRQEQELCLDRVNTIQFMSGNCFTVEYVNPATAGHPDRPAAPDADSPAKTAVRPPRGRQLKLF